MERLKAGWGWTEEEIRNLSPKQWHLIDRGAEFPKYRIIAEVVKAHGCLCHPKLGDKFVFHASGFLLPKETTFPRICVWALAPMVPFIYMVYDRIAQDTDPTSLSIDYIKCLDTGVECGGYGEVLFHIYCERHLKFDRR